MMNRFNVILMVLTAFFGIALFQCLSFVVLRDRHAVEGMVPRGSNVVKDAVSYALLKLFTSKNQTPKNYHDLEAFHVTEPSEFDLNSKHFCENYYFWAGNDESFLYTIRLSFTEDHGGVIISWFTVAIDGVDWSLPQPDFDISSNQYRAETMSTEARAPGIGHVRFDVIDPGREWSLKYEGQMIGGVTGSEMRYAKAQFTVKLSEKNVFFYREDWDLLSVARAMAEKSWASVSFWTDLHSQRQHRYSSRARVSGSMAMYDSIDGQNLLWSRHNISTYGSRDHNWGIRDWAFIRRYIWFPPLSFRKPMTIDGIAYTHMTGTFVDYGTTFSNLVVGAIISDDGAKLPFVLSTPMRKIAPRWYAGDNITSGASQTLLGRRTVPGAMSFSVILLLNSSSSCMLNITVQRGHSFEMWDHSFYFQSGMFEIHEAQTKWNIKLKCGDNINHSSEGLSTTAIGLLEFGANLRPLNEE